MKKNIYLKEVLLKLFIRKMIMNCSPPIIYSCQVLHTIKIYIYYSQSSFVCIFFKNKNLGNTV